MDAPHGELETFDATSSGERTADPDRTAGELRRGATLGRYVALGKLGMGGMGVVYAAYDPELDRKVALKLLLQSPGDGADNRARLLREAQALAKLSHPNIVAVHDVGTAQGRVWIAMEFVAGKTLRAWLDERRRAWHEVLSVMTAAGRGLAAAHAAGLVHRDFKPDNVMIGDDGRVRVMDFGLARVEHTAAARTDDGSVERGSAQVPRQAALSNALTRAGSVLGTPAYMAAEQHAGLSTDARTDLFALCVTMWEALYGQRPYAGGSLVELSANVLDGRVRDPPAHVRVPRWLRAIVRRGLLPKPALRFATVESLLEALARGQRRARARRVLAAAFGVALLGAGVAAAQQLDVRARKAACEREGSSIAAVWNDDARARLREGLVATGVSYAPTTADKVMPWLDDQARAWQRARTDACLDATVHGEHTADTLDRSLWCLDERRDELEALVAELTRADATVVPKAVTAVAAGLAKVDACRDAAMLDRLPSPPVEQREAARALHAELARAGALSRAGKYAEGLAVARSVRERADALAWPPLAAAARGSEASLLERAGDYEAAEQAGASAYFEAARVGAWDVAAAAASRLAFVVGSRRARPTDGLAWGRHAEVALAHAGDPDQLREAVRRNVVASVHLAAGEHAQARTHFERALAILEQALGADHPDVAISLVNLANLQQSVGEYASARALSERAIAILEQTLGADHPSVATSVALLANVYSETGDDARARVLHERALAVRERTLVADHPDIAHSLNSIANLHVAAGEHEKARALHERSLAILEKALGRDHPDVAVSLTNLAGLSLPHDGERALPLLERALAIYDAHEGAQNGELTARFSLARALVETGGDRARARALAEAARVGWRAGGEASAGKLGEVERWMAEREW